MWESGKRNNKYIGTHKYHKLVQRSQYTEQEKTEMLCGPSALLVLRLEIIFSTSIGDK